MDIRRLSLLGPPAAVAIGAGIAAGLLFSVAGQLTVLALAMAWLAPLPIMIAVLAFGPAVGAGAVASAAFTAMAIFWLQQPDGGLAEAARTGLAFTLVLGLPALWLSFLTLQSRLKNATAWSIARPSTSPYLREYSPLDRILTTAVAISAMLTVLAVLLLVQRHGSLQAAVAQMADELTPFLERILGRATDLPGGLDVHSAARLIILATPPLAAGSHLFMMMLNLWLAARVTLVSGRLARPWPDVAHELRLPRIYGVFLVVASVASFAGGLAGLIAAIVAVTIGTAFAMQGLAVVHDFSRGSKWRVPLLVLIYGGLPLFVPWSLVPFVLLGLVDAALLLRDRKTPLPPGNKD